MRIALADDHRLVRDGLRALLEADGRYEVVAEADDGLQVVPLVEKERPDVLLLDLMMPGLHGLDVIDQLVKRVPSTKVIVLTMHSDEAYVVRALRSGATGYVLKDAPGSELLHAIDEVSGGRRYLSSRLSQRAIELYLSSNQASDDDPYLTLTPREREVLHLAVEGSTTSQIAQRLSISPRTVEVHRGNLMRKLGLRNIDQLVTFARSRGLIAAD